MLLLSYINEGTNAMPSHYPLKWGTHKKSYRSSSHTSTNDHFWPHAVELISVAGNGSLWLRGNVRRSQKLSLFTAVLWRNATIHKKEKPKWDSIFGFTFLVYSVTQCKMKRENQVNFFLSYSTKNINKTFSFVFHFSD